MLGDIDFSSQRERLEKGKQIFEWS